MASIAPARGEDARAAAGPVVPEARQGPGPMPAQVLNALDLRLKRRTSAVLPGEHLSAGLGSGVELAQLRAYVPGDDVRRLDAAATARTREPHVRVEVPERALTTWLVADLSASMAFGTAERLKSDVVEGVAGALARLGTRRGNRVGAILCGAGELRTLPPRGGRAASTAVRRAVEAGVGADGAPAAGLAEALRRADRLARSGGLVVVISDFLREDDAWVRPVRALAQRHDVLCVEVRDPREDALPDVGVVWLQDPATGRQVQVDTRRRRVREAFAAAAAERRALTAARVRSTRARHAVLSTEGHWLRDLGRVLR